MFLPPSDVVPMNIHPGPELGGQSLFWRRSGATSVFTHLGGLTYQQSTPSSEHLRDLGL